MELINVQQPMAELFKYSAEIILIIHIMGSV